MSVCLCVCLALGAPPLLDGSASSALCAAAEPGAGPGRATHRPGPGRRMRGLVRRPRGPGAERRCTLALQPGGGPAPSGSWGGRRRGRGVRTPRRCPAESRLAQARPRPGGVMSVSLSVCVSVCLSVCLWCRGSVCAPIGVSFWRVTVSLSVSISVCLSVCLALGAPRHGRVPAEAALCAAKRVLRPAEPTCPDPPETRPLRGSE
jgi:hypothetical protein